MVIPILSLHSPIPGYHEAGSFYDISALSQA
jgi:hypothetical protein